MTTSNHLILYRPLLLLPSILKASGSYPMNRLFKLRGQSIGATASASVLPINIKGWFPLVWTGWISLQSTGLSRVFFSTTAQKHQSFGTLPSLRSDSHSCTGPLEKQTALTTQTFVSKVMLFNTLSQFVTAFLPRSNCFLKFQATATICSDFRIQENKVSHCFHCSPIYLPWSDGTRCHDLSFLNAEF